MTTLAPDNVVRFPDSARNSTGSRDPSRTLNDAREFFAQKLREAIRTSLAEIQEDLAGKGDLADERDERNFYYGGRELLQENAVRLEGLVAAHWLKYARAVMEQPEVVAKNDGVTSADLSLVGLDDMEEQIAVRALAGRLHDGCEEGLYAAGKRFAYLAGAEELARTLETVVADAIRAALLECAMTGPLRTEVLEGMGRRATTRFAPAVHELNAFLVGRRVLPTLRRSYGRKKPERVADAASGAIQNVDAGDVFTALQRLVGASAVAGAIPAAGGGSGGASAGGPMVGMGPIEMAAAMQRIMASLDTLQLSVPQPGVIPTAGILREFRDSPAGQNLDHLDAVTVDIVATLFDFIFDDPAVADPIKALVGRLQIPVLKVAMLDKTFFSSKSHPARRLLDGISRAAARCGPHADHGDPLYAHIAALIERLQSEFKQDAGVFDQLCTELNGFLEQQEHDADERAAKVAPLVIEQERRELAAVAADSVLSSWLSAPLAEPVADLLTHEWRTLLVHRYLEDDTDGWESAITTAGELVASVQPVADAAGRKRLATTLPTLVKHVHDALDRSAVTMERRMSLLDSLFSLHAAVLRGATPAVPNVLGSTTPQRAPELIAQSITADDAIIIENLSLLDADNVPVLENDTDSQRRVDELQRGDWVEFPGGDTGPVRYRLSWVSPERGILLFTNPHSPKAMSVAPAALALQLERGEAAIVPVEPIFDRAVNRALETLKAA